MANFYVNCKASTWILKGNLLWNEFLGSYTFSNSLVLKKKTLLKQVLFLFIKPDYFTPRQSVSFYQIKLNDIILTCQLKIAH